MLDRLGIEPVAAPAAGCCGAVGHHLTAPEEGLAFMRRNIDAWWPHIEAGAEALVITYPIVCGRRGRMQTTVY